MSVRRPPNPYQTLEVADPLEALRLRVTLWLLPVGACAALLAWGLSLLSGKLGPVDRFLLLPLALGFAGLELYLLWNRAQIRRVWQIGLSLMGVYEIVGAFYETNHGLYYHPESLSPGLLWFPIVYLMSFVLLGRRQAIVFSAVYLSLGLTAGGLGLLLGPPLELSALNTMLQFVFSNLTYVLLLYIFAHLRYHYAQMHLMAHTDALTGLINRRAMQECLEAELERAKRYDRRFAVLLADIDHFKWVNDNHGHAVGDQVLREVAGRLSAGLRPSDQIARWGGEEFLVLAPETDLAQAQALSGRLFEAIVANPVSGLEISLSIGVACYRQGDSIAGLLSRADEAMYRAKVAGRARVELEDPPHDAVKLLSTQPDPLRTTDESASPPA
ncbi:GGDEF domain-containing protein [Meiothermus granaticius]|uniref:Response regulator PleD n=1 Tax=Meiothermus granaticius NBRC 107808 TaxID=1227551 RepID=A0A399F8G0_9DEIN|nr:GGDEF domain-containing protein [Meiothermus granaticius]RIH91182.1 Response regulator PleD [Meiothermus granaticius NBRC 107808]GEM87469.1 GGDEF domain-containing protein [Meiothermus granaticius NBRC 107808]